MKTVLVTDALQRKALAVARSLGRRGIKVITADSTRCHPAGFSRYSAASWVYPDPGRSPHRFINWLKATVQRHPGLIVFPMDDLTLRLIMSDRDEIEKYCILPVPSLSTVQALADKGSAVKIAQELGLLCPTNIYRVEYPLPQATAQLTYPLLIKPRHSSGSRGIRLVHSPEELEASYRSVSRLYPEPLIQEYIGQGTRFDVCLLLDGQGELKASFVQKELRHFPLDMGPSTVQESVCYPELVEQALALARRVSWRGILEVEFMLDKQGRPVFMEANPRFWNSLHLAVTAGIDFPWLLYQFSCGEKLPTVVDYPTGLKCRWLLPGDLLHFLANKKRREMVPPFWPISQSQLNDDIISSTDPWPSLGFLLSCLRYLFSRRMWKMLFYR